MKFHITAKELAEQTIQSLSHKIFILENHFKIVPGLAVIKVGNDAASEIYVNNKVKTSKEIGINSFKIEIPENTSETTLIKKIQMLNHDPKVHGILVQLPLPNGLNSSKILQEIDPMKDVDGLHPLNVGKLSMGSDGLFACTPLGCITLLKILIDDFQGLNAVVVGRSNLVGKPMAQLLLKENCTVTICHSRTKNLQEHTSRADILVVAVGKANFITRKFVKKGAIVLDVGINRLAEGKLCGDVDYNDVKDKAGFITPVPGGIGRMTIASLMLNTVKAVCAQKEINFETLKHEYKHSPLS
jgi:methylenetetrahydrofolate dehydrogenase (NADP+)/methenyltetrahydrofolate cyclohydrolase